MKQDVVITQFHGATTMDALPLAAGLLVSAARSQPELDAAFAFAIRFRREEPAAVAAAIGTPAVLAVSCYAWNLRYSLEVVRRVRAASPDTFIVLGGPEIPRRPDAARAFMDAHPAVDALVCGEGERTFVEVLTARLEGRPPDGVLGVVHRSGDAIVVEAPRPRSASFDDLRSPFLDGTFDALLADHADAFHAVVLETNRGCPFACTFCDWGQATQSRVHELPLGRVEAELTWAAERGIPYVYLVDANFGIRPRDQGIVRHIAALKGRTGYPAYCYFHLTKNARERNLATVTTLREAGVGCEVALSMQDFDADVLAAIERANIKPAKALALRAVCAERGIPTFNELILGLPAQTLAGFRRSILQAVTPHLDDTFYLYVCRLLPNAAMASPEHRARFGLRTRLCRMSPRAEGDTVHVDEVEEVVVATASMPPDDWSRAHAFGHLLAALHNARVGHVLVRYLKFACGDAALTRWLDRLLARMPDACGPLGAMHAELERFQASARAGGTLRLPIEGAGPAMRGASEALAIAALRDHDAFLDAVAAPLREAAPDAPAALIDELLRLQALVTPTPARREVALGRFERDWLGWLRRPAAAAPDPGSERRVRYVPPAYVLGARDFPSFAGAYLAATYAKSWGPPVVAG